jgi:hypothetical protein
MPQFMPSEIAQVYRAAYEAKGVVFHTNTTVKTLDAPNGQVGEACRLRS